MSVTLETQVAGIMNTVLGLVAQASDLKVAIDRLSATWSSLGGGTAANAFPTAASTTTGGLGTADATPVSTHVIDTRVAPGTLVNRAVSPSDLGAMLTYLQGLSSAINGTAIAANATAPNLLAKAS